MHETILIPEQFRGPPRSGNGGYVTGVFASLLGQASPDTPQPAAAEVTLRAPVPLDTPLTVQREAAALRIVEGERLIAEVCWSTLELAVPAAPSFEEALALRDESEALRVGVHPAFGGRRTGFHPICFCCGAELAPDKGLHVYPAKVADGRVAAAWVAPSAFANAQGTLPSEIICAALDCPGQFGWLAGGVRTGLLGRLTPRIERPVHAGERCVVLGWSIAQEGRKFLAGTALFNEDRALCAFAKAVWIGRVTAGGAPNSPNS
jgi:hypothetical protein